MKDFEYFTKEIENGEYTVSTKGLVYSNKRKKYLKPIDNGNGYKMVCMCVEGKITRKYVHRLVAELFIPNPLNLPEVNHKDEDRGNNNANNLEWCTPKYNKNYGSRAEKYGMSRGRAVVCIETGKIYYSCGEAERQTGISKGSIWACCTGYRNLKTVRGFHWAFA